MDTGRRQEAGDFVAWVCHVIANANRGKDSRPVTPAECHPLKKAKKGGARRIRVRPVDLVNLLAKQANAVEDPNGSK